MIDKLKSLLYKPQEQLPEQIKRELEIAIALKKIADANNLPLKIEIPSLNVSYWYDPIEHKLKQEKLKLLKYINSKLVKRQQQKAIEKLLNDIEL